jgi:hypothetical protein
MHRLDRDAGEHFIVRVRGDNGYAIACGPENLLSTTRCSVAERTELSMQTFCCSASFLVHGQLPASLKARRVFWSLFSPSSAPLAASRFAVQKCAVDANVAI